MSGRALTVAGRAVQVRDKLFKTRELLHHCLSHPKENLLETLQRSGGYTSAAPLLDELKLLHRSLIDTGDDGIADCVVRSAIRRVTTFGSSLVRLDIRQESTRHSDVMAAITSHLDLGSFQDWSERDKQTWLTKELQARPPTPPTPSLQPAGFDTRLIFALRRCDTAYTSLPDIHSTSPQPLQPALSDLSRRSARTHARTHTTHARTHTTAATAVAAAGLRRGRPTDMPTCRCPAARTRAPCLPGNPQHAPRPLPRRRQRPARSASAPETAAVLVQSKRPLFPLGLELTPDQQNVVDTFRVLATLPPDSLGAYIISMAQTASDVLTVVLLQRELGVKQLLRVVPLFETLEDLNNAPSTMDQLFSNDWYRTHIGGAQECMIGYSDSGAPLWPPPACAVQPPLPHRPVRARRLDGPAHRAPAAALWCNSSGTPEAPRAQGGCPTPLRWPVSGRMCVGKDAGRLAAAWALYQAQETLTTLASEHSAASPLTNPPSVPASPWARRGLCRQPQRNCMRQPQPPYRATDGGCSAARLATFRAPHDGRVGL